MRSIFISSFGLAILLAGIAGRATAGPQQRSLEERVTSLERRIDQLENPRTLPDLYNLKYAGDFKSYELAKDASQVQLRREVNGETVNTYYLISPQDRTKAAGINWWSDECRVGRSSNPKFPYLIGNIEEGIAVEALVLAP